jgi:hypothetical protein
MKLVLPLVSVISFALGVGCSPKPHSYWPDGAVEFLDRGYDQYLTGDVDQARRALRESIALMLATDARAYGRAHGLWLGYSRLFVLEQFAGSAQEALASFDAAKRWYRLKLETRGNSGHEIEAALDEFTATYCRELVRRFDAARTEERGPRYLNKANVETAVTP